MTGVAVRLPSSVRWMRALVALIVVAVAGYATFMIVERAGTATGTVRGAVLGKRYIAAHRTYSTEIINGRAVPVPKDVPDAYVVDVATPLGRTTGAVTEVMYGRVAVGDSVTARVRRGRLSGAVAVLDVSR